MELKTSRCGSARPASATPTCPSAYTPACYYPEGLTTVPFSPALYDTFTVITRAGGRLSPGVRELLAALEEHLRSVAAQLDRSR